MFYAEMKADGFTFRAVASTPRGAKAAIKRGWKKHMKQFSEYSGQAAEEIEMWYGIRVGPITINDCTRNWEDLAIH